MKNTRSVSIKPWFNDLTLKIDYTIYLASLGYERRARFISEEIDPNAKERIVSSFKDRNVLSFSANKKFFQKNNYTILYHTDAEFKQWVEKDFYELIFTKKRKVIKILIDFSSMSRHRIASLISCLRTFPGKFTLVVDFVYAPANYSKPVKDSAPIVKSGPVLKEFAGWSTNPDLPTGLIIGLGYDYGKAVGAVEYIEPGELWALTPKGGDERYEKAIEEANASIVTWLSKHERIISYDTFRPFELFTSLNSLCSGLVRIARPIIVPFGPKTFTLCSLLVATLNHPSISVWRISSDKFGKASNRTPTGDIIGISCEFKPYV